MKDFEKDFIPYALAVRMKEIGFDEECLAYYDGWNFKSHLIISNESGSFLSRLFRLFIKTEYNRYNQPYVEYLGGICTAPTFSQCFRWFREKYGYTYTPIKYIKWRFEIEKIVDNLAELDHVFLEEGYEEYDTYEEAELWCLDKLIEIVKLKK